MLARALGKTIRWTCTSVAVRNARFHWKGVRYAFESQIWVIFHQFLGVICKNVPSTWQDILIRTEIECTYCRHSLCVWLRCLPNYYHSNLATRNANETLRLNSAMFHTPFQSNSCEFDSRHSGRFGRRARMDASRNSITATLLFCATILALNENAQLHTCADISSTTLNARQQTHKMYTMWLWTTTTTLVIRQRMSAYLFSPIPRNIKSKWRVLKTMRADAASLPNPQWMWSANVMNGLFSVLFVCRVSSSIDRFVVRNAPCSFVECVRVLWFVFNQVPNVWFLVCPLKCSILMH